MHTVAMNNRSVPVSAVLPHLTYRDITEACEWLKRVFGFKEHFRYGQPVAGIQMFLGGAVIMISGPRDKRQSPAVAGWNTQMVTIVVPNVDTHFARTRAEGAMIWEELHETVYGERQYGVEDLDGHRWIFATHARDVSPEEWGATVVNRLP
ncbi:MAG TPA: VOC family protein [Terracidiphilus sp.]|nr:VOC family protein [Terracidiphilus sp.]